MNLNLPTGEPLGGPSAPHTYVPQEGPPQPVTTSKSPTLLAAAGGSTACRTLQMLVNNFKAYARDERRKLDDARTRAEAYERAALETEMELDKLPKEMR